MLESYDIVGTIFLRIHIIYNTIQYGIIKYDALVWFSDSAKYSLLYCVAKPLVSIIVFSTYSGIGTKSDGENERVD